MISALVSGRILATIWAAVGAHSGDFGSGFRSGFGHDLGCCWGSFGGFRDRLEVYTDYGPGWVCRGLNRELIPYSVCKQDVTECTCTL